MAWVVQLTFLGTGGGMPSPSRGVSAIALQADGDVLLFDCGEGTQRQLMRSTVSFMKIKAIFISHFHGDHFLGLPGLIQSMNFSGRGDVLEVFGPPGMIDLLDRLVTLGHFDLSFPVQGGELVDGDLVEVGGMTVKAVEGDHSVPCLSYVVEEPPRRGRFDPERARELGIPSGPLFGALQRGEEVTWQGRLVRPSEVMGPARRGRKVVFSGDTRPSQRLVHAAWGASVLVHEATLDSSLEEGARSFGHSTAKEAGEVARDAHVDLLVLTHFSNRYEDTTLLRDEARQVFPLVQAARDLMTIQVPLPEDLS